MPRILVVDDRQELRFLLKRMLTTAGHEVVEASGGTAALAEVERGVFEVVITDMHMPDGDGPELTRALQQMERPPAIIAMSGNDVAMTFRMARMLGAKVVLPKPFTMSQVLEAVTQVLAGESPSSD